MQKIRKKERMGESIMVILQKRRDTQRQKQQSRIGNQHAECTQVFIVKE